MARRARQAPGGYVYHVLNRGVNRQRLFAKDADFAAFTRVMAQTLGQRPMRLLAYCLMPNHWHLVLWPKRDAELAALMQRLTVTHVTRWQEHFHCVGQGHVYQGRFKSFPAGNGPEMGGRKWGQDPLIDAGPEGATRSMTPPAVSAPPVSALLFRT